MAADTKAEFVDGEETGITMVRFHNSDATGAKVAWPAGEIDENASRYLDFAITAPETMDVRITGITMDIAAHSTSTMCYHINTGFGDGFTDVQTIADEMREQAAAESIRNALNRALSEHQVNCRVLDVSVHIQSDGCISINEVTAEGNLLTGAVFLQEWLGDDVTVTEGGMPDAPDG